MFRPPKLPRCTDDRRAEDYLLCKQEINKYLETLFQWRLEAEHMNQVFNQVKRELFKDEMREYRDARWVELQQQEDDLSSSCRSSGFEYYQRLDELRRHAFDEMTAYEQQRRQEFEATLAETNRFAQKDLEDEHFDKYVTFCKNTFKKHNLQYELTPPDDGLDAFETRLRRRKS